MDEVNYFTEVDLDLKALGIVSLFTLTPGVQLLGMHLPIEKKAFASVEELSKFLLRNKDNIIVFRATQRQVSIAPNEWTSSFDAMVKWDHEGDWPLETRTVFILRYVDLSHLVLNHKDQYAGK